VKSIVYYLLSALLSILIGFLSWRFVHERRFSRTLPHQKITSSKQLEETYIAKVGSEYITEHDLQFEYKLQIPSAIENDPSSPDLKSLNKLKSLRQLILTQMIKHKLLYHLVTQDTTYPLNDPKKVTNCLKNFKNTLDSYKKFSQQDQEKLKKTICETYIIEDYLASYLFLDISVSDKEVREYFKNKHFKKKRKVIVRQIVLGSEGLAKKIRTRLNRKNFKKYALQESITEERHLGGLLPPFSKGEMPPIFDIVFRMKEKKISHIFKSPYGFHIFFLEKIIPATKSTLPEVRAQIIDFLLKQKKQKKYQQWLKLALHTVTVFAP